MMGQPASPPNEPSVHPGSGPHYGRCDSARVYLSVWLYKAGCDSVAGQSDRLHGYCCRRSTPLCLPLWLPLSLHLREAGLWRKADLGQGRGINTAGPHAQPVGLSLGKHTMTTTKKALLWLPLHAWCGPMMAHPWPGDEKLMNCQEPNSFKWEIDRQGLHIGNIIDMLVCLDFSLQVIMSFSIFSEFPLYI